MADKVEVPLLNAPEVRHAPDVASKRGRRLVEPGMEPGVLVGGGLGGEGRHGEAG